MLAQSPIGHTAPSSAAFQEPSDPLPMSFVCKKSVGTLVPPHTRARSWYEDGPAAAAASEWFRFQTQCLSV